MVETIAKIAIVTVLLGLFVALIASVAGNLSVTSEKARADLGSYMDRDLGYFAPPALALAFLAPVLGSSTLPTYAYQIGTAFVTLIGALILWVFIRKVIGAVSG